MEDDFGHPPEPPGVVIHPLTVRVGHWINAIAIFVMILSGWRIYNASPLFPFRFPDNLTLGGWLAGALQWHFAAMWLLVINGFVYILYGIISGHYRRQFFPIPPRAVVDELGNLARGRLSHRLGTYNAVQKLAYVVVILLGVVLVLSGLAMWKPVQFQGLAALMGGYEGARLVHFFAMAGVVVFIVIHLTLVILVPRTLPPMFTGRAPRRATLSEGEPLT
ncbi:thioredoxin reductase [Sulfurifustis variabilis]|uniref:Thioredoxin reductase n=1 Tax=Sulfurifustis variabilis TaxID=1675686 RepID=A0A1B4VB94_9GAMM|nr:cytochrome b/b6 domain-containing protein [Sulfurifustis variabilis]BAU49414.1 thioredoxin reductase [Sulfurifustis variabilis]